MEDKAGTVCIEKADSPFNGKDLYILRDPADRCIAAFVVWDESDCCYMFYPQFNTTMEVMFTSQVLLQIGHFIERLNAENQAEAKN